MTNKNIGIDVGFGFVKAADGTQRYLFPSVVGEGHGIRFNTEMAYNSILDNLIVNVDDEKYFVGELANRQSQFLLSTQSEKRIGSIENGILFKTALALLYGADLKEAEFNLVTGLPVDEYKQFKDDLMEQLQDEHNVEIVIGDSGFNKKITINNCKVIPQPFGTVFNELLTDTGEIKNKEYANTVGVVDIGFRTTDFVVTDRLEFIDKLSYTSNMALNTAYKHISNQIKNQLAISKPIYQLDEIVRAGTININSKQYDITELIDKAFSLAAQQIVSEINSFWPQLWEFEKILITGGGGVALYDYIKNHIDNCHLVQNGQFSNVSGYVKVANRSFKE